MKTRVKYSSHRLQEKYKKEFKNLIKAILIQKISFIISLTMGFNFPSIIYQTNSSYSTIYEVDLS